MYMTYMYLYIYIHTHITQYIYIYIYIHVIDGLPGLRGLGLLGGGHLSQT